MPPGGMKGSRTFVFFVFSAVEEFRVLPWEAIFLDRRERRELKG